MMMKSSSFSRTEKKKKTKSNNRRQQYHKNNTIHQDGLVRVSTIDEDDHHHHEHHDDTDDDDDEHQHHHHAHIDAVDSYNNTILSTTHYDDSNNNNNTNKIRLFGITSILLLLYSIIITIIYIQISSSKSSSSKQQEQTQSSSSSSTTDDTTTTTTTNSLLSFFYYSTLFNITIPIFKEIPNFHTTTLTKIAFGSCSSQNMGSLPYWDTIATTYQPNLFLLLGDNVYADCTGTSSTTNSTTTTTTTTTTVDDNNNCIELQIAYQKLASHPSVIGSAQHISIIPILDDHDYGQSDATKYNPYKDIAIQYFNEFFQLQNSLLPLITTTTTTIQPNDNNKDGSGNNNGNGDGGVYRSGIWGQSESEYVQIILLDTRYMRSPFLTSLDPHNPYIPYPYEYNYHNKTDDKNQSIQMLSNQQWDWLRTELKKPAQIRFIISSIQVLNNNSSFECWRHIPWERDKLYNLLYDASIDDHSTIVFLSGDRHVGGFYQMNYTKKEEEENDDNNNDSSNSNDYPKTITLTEVTSSSLTHSIPYGTYNQNCTGPMDCDEYDPIRIGNFIRQNQFGSIDIDYINRTIIIGLRRTDNSYGSAFVSHTSHVMKSSDAGEVLQSITIPF